VVEGSTAALVDDVRQHPFHVLEHLSSWNAQGPISQRMQLSIAVGIAPRTITIAVVIAVNLDQQAASETREIRDVTANWILLPKLQALRSRTQDIPKQHFR
jgi:hypothetical protein